MISKASSVGLSGYNTLLRPLYVRSFDKSYMWLPITVLVIHVCIVCRFSNTGISRDYRLKIANFWYATAVKVTVGISALGLCDTVKNTNTHQHCCLTDYCIRHHTLGLKRALVASIVATAESVCTHWLRLNDDRQCVVTSTLLAWSDRTIHYAY